MTDQPTEAERAKRVEEALADAQWSNYYRDANYDPMKALEKSERDLDTLAAEVLRLRAIQDDPVAMVTKGLEGVTPTWRKDSETWWWAARCLHWRAWACEKSWFIEDADATWANGHAEGIEANKTAAWDAAKRKISESVREMAGEGGK